jgi:MFS family permease
VIRPRWRGPFADARFRRLLIGQSLSGFGDTALYLTLGIWAKALTHSNAAAGAVFLALGIPALFAPLAGHLADRVRRRPLLLWANAVTAVMVLSLLAVRSPAQLWILYLVAFSYGVAFTVLSSAGAGLRKDLLPADDLAAASAAFQSIGYGLRIVAPLAGAALFVLFGGQAVAVLDAATFAAAIAALLSIKLAESAPDPAHAGSFRREVTAGFRHLRAVPLLAQTTFVTAAAFSIIGLDETIIFAVIGQGLHRPPSFLGVLSSAQGAGAIAAGILTAPLLRRIGSARMIGLALGGFVVESAAYLSGSAALVLAGSFVGGAGLLWLVAVSGAATQRYTPPRLQGRANAAWTMAVITPQTISIAASAALISYVSYRTLLMIVLATIGACGTYLLARPAPEPVADAPLLNPVSQHPDRPPAIRTADAPASRFAELPGWSGAGAPGGASPRPEPGTGSAGRGAAQRRRLDLHGSDAAPAGDRRQPQQARSQGA